MASANAAPMDVATSFMRRTLPSNVVVTPSGSLRFAISSSSLAVAVPSALDADDNVERSGQIVATTAVYRELVDDLELLLDDPSVSLNARDRGITLEWLADWDAFLDDRLDYAERLSGDPEAVFYVAASSGGERLERRISRFATTNEMYNCVTPSDVG